ncbi:FUSC family protein [Cupriavidus sp. M-11]|uniref:FUSC family protein n=1 Tax=Cupriavidus sp. M-11 TaxID=3233038 RepID=UPI003F8E6204
MGEKTHLGRAIHWSAGPQAHAGEMLAAGLGMAAPLLLAGAMGHQPLGLAAALGSLAIGSGTTPAAPGSEAEMARSAGAQARELAALLAPFAAAAAVAAACSGHGAASDAIVILLAVAAAAIGAYSRPLAVASTRLLLFLVIAANSAGAAPYRGGFLLLALAGALAAAAALRWLFPGHHFDWIALTVALLIQRQPGLPSLKTTQRVGGTVLGVLLAALLLGHQLPAWVIAVNAGWLAGMRPLLRSRNYLAYSAAMTPLMVLITGAGNASTAGAMSGMLADRVAATVIGAALVILADGVALRLLAKPLSRTSPG